MSDRTSRISTLDRVISYFSPTFGIKRIRAKAAIDAFAYGGGGYTGAKTRHGLSNTVSVGDDTDHSLSRARYQEELPHSPHSEKIMLYSK